MAASQHRKAMPVIGSSSPPRPSFGETFRRSMSDEELRDAGRRVYDKFTEEEKMKLHDFIRQRLQQSCATNGDPLEWQQMLEEHTNSTIRRRAAAGQPIEAEYIIDEVVPFALSTVKDDVRRDLFVKVSEMLR